MSLCFGSMSQNGALSMSRYEINEIVEIMKY